MHTTKRRERERDVRRIFEEFGLGNVELLESWAGDDLEELADFLTEEEFQTLLDELRSQDGDRTQ